MRKLLILFCFSFVAWKLFLHFRPALPAALTAPTLTPVTGALVAGGGHTLALSDNGELYGWGVNEDKQLGLANVFAATAPMALPSPVRWRAIHSGDRASYAIGVDGTLWRRSFNSWTYAGGDKLGVQMEYTPIMPSLRWRKAQEGWGLGMGLDESGALWLWDDRAFAAAVHPDPAKDAAVPPQAVGSGKQWRDFCVNQGSFMAVDAEGRLWQGPTPTDTFRNIFQDATQDGASITAPALMPIAAAAKFQRVFCRPNASQTFALDAHGRLWGFGRNSFGELGDGDGDGFTSNQAVTTIKPLTDRNWIDIGVGVGGVTVGVAGDGTLWAWGNNSSGQLGTGNREYRDRPTLVDARPIWRAAAVSHSMAAALTRDGQIYVWGAGSVRNPRGETLYLLGDGGVADVRLTPTPVASTVIWKKGS